MTPERWQQVKEIFNSALQHEPAQRSVFLSNACGGDEVLRQEVESLISSHEKDGSFIDSPAYEAAAAMLETERQLKAGHMIGHYEILSTLGKGGMGEVYLARDTRLDRKVALKFLPPDLIKDDERVRRFAQEARAASSLNHPNILTIYEIGSGGGRQFIAAEYVEGETLRQRMIHSRLSVLEALDIAIQVASALVAAHHANIVHRDIKPENIMMRHDGYVKVVDFGLAKLTEAPIVSANTSKPTLLQIDTDTGMVMGTTAYMSPEQARGLGVDARSDIWSLGVVMYEMVAARPPFEGDTRSDILVAILERQPVSLVDISAEVPESFDWIVAKALTKEPEERYQTAREILSDLRRLKQKLDLIAAQKHSSPTPRAASEDHADDSTRRSTTLSGAATDETNPIRETIPHAAISHWPHNRLTLVLAASIVLALVIGFVWSIKRFGRTDTGEDSKTSSQVLRATQITFSSGLDGFPSLSPDAKSVVYSSDQNGRFEIYIRQLTPGGGELQLTNDGQQNVQPSWSPDGQRIAYYSKNRGGIWVISALGGVVKQLTESGSRPTWSPDGSTIAFQSGASGEIFASRTMPPSTIWIVPSQGGAPRQITRPGNPPGGHASPSWSPDGKRLAFDDSDYIFSSIWSVAIAGGEPRKITEGNNPIYAPDGQHIYYQGAADPGLSKLQLAPSGEPIGEPASVLGLGPGTALRNPAISADGKKIVYSASRTSSNLWSISLSPASADALGPPSPFSRDTSQRNNLVRFSPDGHRLALTRWRPGTSADIWVADADGTNLTQVTNNPATDSQPNWFPQSDKLAFLSDRDKLMKLWTISLATGKEEPFLDLGEGVQFAQLSPDTKQVAFNLIQNGAMNVWVVSVKDGQRKQLTFDSQLMGFPCWSPDGQFLAFEMQRGDEAYLMVIPSSGGQPTQLTFDHAKSWPHDWSPDGDKIVFAGQRDGVWNIYWISRTTKAQKQLTNYSKLNAFVRYPAWSPLGNQIVYEYAETTGNIWLMELK